MIQNIPSLNELAGLILAKMYEHMLTSDNPDLNGSGIQTLFKTNQPSLAYLQQGLGRLTRGKLLRRLDGFAGGPFFRLTEEGVSAIQNQLEDIEIGGPETTVTRYLQTGGVEVKTTQVPASDRIVTLDHNSRDYQEATKQYDAVTEAVRGKNDIDQATKEELLTDLSTGRGLLGQTKAWANLLRTWTIGVLQKTIQKIQDEGIKALAVGAIEALKQLFKSWVF